MDLKDIVSITGMPGLYKIEAQRDNGIIVKPLLEEKRKFISGRQNLFTPLENITIYTDDDGMELQTVFQRMYDRAESLPPVSAKADNQSLHDYFEEVVPEYDAERVYASDIKKILKWYEALDQAGLLAAQAAASGDEEE